MGQELYSGAYPSCTNMRLLLPLIIPLLAHSAFLQNFNAGKRKRVCPSWLKAPGGQLFHWGKLPRFTGQEPIDELVARYREEYFDGHRIVQVTDRVIWEVRCSAGST